MKIEEIPTGREAALDTLQSHDTRQNAHSSKEVS
jgi:hypothetical protein